MLSFILYLHKIISHARKNFKLSCSLRSWWLSFSSGYRVILLKYFFGSLVFLIKNLGAMLLCYNDFSVLLLIRISFLIMSTVKVLTYLVNFMWFSPLGLNFYWGAGSRKSDNVSTGMCSAIETSLHLKCCCSYTFGSFVVTCPFSVIGVGWAVKPSGFTVSSSWALTVDYVDTVF